MNMYEKVDINSDEFELLKQFCFLIGEGRLEPQVEETHFMYLYHPTVTGAFLIVYWDAMHRQFYIREPREGVGCDLDALPLVHDFPLHGRPIFPSAVVLDIDTMNLTPAVRYIYEGKEEGETTSMTVPRDQYERLKFLFDDEGVDAKNPIPWEEC